MTWQTEFDEMYQHITNEKNRLIYKGYQYVTVHACIKAFIQDLLDRKAEAYIEKLKNEIDDWYTLPPAYRNKAELKGRLDQALNILKEE